MQKRKGVKMKTLENGYIINQNDMYLYFEIINQIEPDSIIDIGMFLKRIGAISRQVNGFFVPDNVVLDGIDIMPHLSVKVYEKIYDNIASIADLIGKTLKDDLKICKEVIAKNCPEYLNAFDLCMNCNLFSLGNMIITRKEIFDNYCSWLFPILFELERKIDIKVYDISPLKVDFNGKMPVWVCWWQGEDEAPELVKTCIASIKKNIPEDIAGLHIITLDNVGKYITLPSWIIEKFEAGKISLTHLSDILRMGLLYRYGGMWIDATYFISDKIPKEVFQKGVFYTQRMDKTMWRADITQGRWAGNVMRGEKGNVLFRFALNAMYMYWCTQDTMIDYYLIDYIIALAYDNIVQVREMIDACPYSQPNIFELKKVINKKYNPNIYKNMVKNTYMFKLSHRIDVSRYNIVGEKTFYGYICEKLTENLRK